MNIETHVKTFKEWMAAKGLSQASTQATYAAGATTFLWAFKNESHPKNINAQQIIQFLGTIPSPHTRKSIYYAAKLMYTVVFNQPNKFDHIPSPDIPQALPVILTPEECYNIINAKRKNIKHQTILQLIYSGALRISEPIAIKQQHISKQYEPVLQKEVVSLHIVNAKGDKDRIIPLPMDTYNLIENYKQQVKPVDYLFNGWQGNSQYSAESIRAVFDDAVKICGITKEVTPHSLRHSMATHLLDAGFSLPYLMKFMGHNSIETTMIYVHCSHTSSAKMLDHAHNYLKASVQCIPLEFEKVIQLQ